MMLGRVFASVILGILAETFTVLTLWVPLCGLPCFLGKRLAPKQDRGADWSLGFFVMLIAAASVVFIAFVGTWLFSYLYGTV